MRRIRFAAWILLLPLLAGCSWRAALGIRRTPPPPGALAADPIVQLRQSAGVPVQAVPGPALPTGQQLVFYRYTKGKECVRGFVVYNPNRTVQSQTQATAACEAALALSRVDVGTAADHTVLFGLVDSATVARVEIILPAGETRPAAVHQGMFYLVDRNARGLPTTTSGLTVVGFDADGKELYRRTEP